METMTLFSTKVTEHLSFLPLPVRAALTLQNVFFFVVSLEVLYFVLLNFFVKSQMQNLSRPPAYPAPNLPFIMRILRRLERVYPSPGTRPALEQFLSGWCLGADFKDIRRGNVVEFLSWATYAKTVEAMEENELADVEAVIEYLKSSHQMDLPPGKNPDVSCARLSLEPFSFIHRPLTFYIGMKFLSYVLKVTLIVCGFSRHHSSSGVKYWYRPPSATCPPSASTLLFFHGIAPCGCLFYLPLLFFSLLPGGRGCLLFDTPPVTMLSHSVDRRPSESDVVSAVAEAAATHCRAGEKLVVAGHSLGSCPVTWVVRALPHLVGMVLLLDPVTLFLSHPDVAYNFVYKRSFKTFMEKVIYYGASSEAFISHYLRRNFWWYRNELFLEDVPSNVPVVVALSLQDEIVNSVLVADGLNRLKGDGVGDHLRVIKLDEHSHAAMIHKPSTWKLIRAAIKQEEAAAAKKKKVL